MRAVRARKAPTIDGDLNDSCWKVALPASNFTILNTEKPSPLKTNVWFAFDDKAVYVAFKCFTTDFSLVRGLPAVRDN